MYYNPTFYLFQAMDMRGKILGGSLGSFLGPWGAAVGAAVGHFMIDRKAPAVHRKQVMRLLVIMTGALHDIACCDGRYTPAKNEIIRLLLCGINERLGKPLDASQLSLLLSGNSRVDHGIIRLAEMVRGQRELSCESLSWLWQVATCEGDVSAHAENLISLFIHHADISPQDARFVASHFVRPPPSQVTGQQDWRSACDMLGVPYTARTDEIRRAYRTLSQKYHPDKHANLDPDIKALTAEKFAQIKRAYDFLTGMRN